jgi:hypothetical protein
MPVLRHKICRWQQQRGGIIELERLCDGRDDDDGALLALYTIHVLYMRVREEERDYGEPHF